MLVVIAACGSSPPAFTYTLKQQAMMIGAHAIAGIDSDRSGGLWIAYRDGSDLLVDHLDADGNQLSEWRYQDDATPVAGITYSGDALWVSYNNVAGGNNHLSKLDPTTGAQLTTFATENGIVDVSWRPGSLLLSNLWSGIVEIDPATGGEQTRIFTPITDSTQRGIAADGERTWVMSWSELILVDAQGKQIANADCPVLPVDGEVDGMELAWDGSQLIVELQDRVVWYSIEGGAP